MTVRQEDMRIVDWRETFNRQYVSRVNVQVIEALKRLIGCKSDREFSTACGSDRWISHVDKLGQSKRSIYYDRLRECAFFLGIPPWVLVAGTQGNEEIRSLFESAPSEAKVMDFSGPRKSLETLTEYFSRAPLNGEQRSEIDDSLAIINNHIPNAPQNLHNSINAVLEYAMKQPAGLRLVHEVIIPSSSGPSYRGTLCFAKGQYQHGEKRVTTKRWMSAWFAVEIELNEKKSVVDIERMLDGITSTLQFRHHWEVKTQPNPATILIVSSWHSGVESKSARLSERTEQERRRRVQAFTAEKLADSHLRMASVHAYDDVLDNFPAETKLREEYADFLSWLTEDVRPEENTPCQTDLLELAVRNGAIRVGTVLYFNQRFVPRNSLLGITQPMAAVVQQGEQVLLSFRDKYYTISDLTSRILRELNLDAWVARCHESQLFWTIDSFSRRPFPTEPPVYSVGGMMLERPRHSPGQTTEDDSPGN